MFVHTYSLIETRCFLIETFVPNWTIPTETIFGFDVLFAMVITWTSGYPLFYTSIHVRFPHPWQSISLSFNHIRQSQANTITFHPTLLHFIQLYYISSNSITFHPALLYFIWLESKELKILCLHQHLILRNLIIQHYNWLSQQISSESSCQFPFKTLFHSIWTIFTHFSMLNTIFSITNHKHINHFCHPLYNRQRVIYTFVYKPSGH